MENQTTIFDILYPKKKITKPIRLIECFAGYGSQALALKYLGVPFEHWKICEWAIKSIQAYKDIHFGDDDKDYVKDFGIKESELRDYLYEKGISSNYNEPMTRQQIDRLSDLQIKKIYNNIVSTHNLVNIQQVKGKDLEIINTDKYEYIMTYSFPCQDLSLAGKGKGMSDTSTRSGMLWEVERILTECHELGNMPQILLMENVPQVHSEDNLQDFNKWKDRLEELGYKNYFQDLIATDYGIPQTRNRCFMVSLLGDYSYTFPKPMPLKLKLKDMLEDDVDEKYYLSDKMKEYIFSEDDKYKVNKNSLKLNRDIACSKTTREGWTRADTSDYIVETCLLKNKGTELTKITDNANTIMARDYKGFGNQDMNAVIELKNIHKTLRETLENNEIKDGVSYKDAYNRKIINDGTAKTIITRIDASNNTYIAIKNNTEKGYLEASEGDGINICKRMEYQRGNVQKDKIQTLDTMGGETKDVVSSDLRIRKLTPRECGRLMNVKDEDIDKILKNQSDSSAYHLFGDSICTNCLMAIFGQLLDIEWEKYLWKVQ